MLELQHLEYLTVIAEEGTMSAAAERLHLSQPALSRSMQRLEASLGLSLFDRGKNRVELNEAGLLAVAHAKAVLSVADEMEQRMKDYKRSLTTITIGSCAPGPLWQLTPEISGRFPGMTLSTYLKENRLLDDLKKDVCQIAILDHPVDEAGLICRPYVAESLSILLPKHHPLASKSGLYLSDLDGITMLVYAHLGIWQKLHDDKMQQIHFIVQHDRTAFNELISASQLPCFSTNLSIQFTQAAENRTAVPILDPEAQIRFYLCAKKKNRKYIEA